MPTSNLDLDRALHAITDPTRRRILAALKINSRGGKAEPNSRKRLAETSEHTCNGLCAGDIEERVRLSQPTISHHMSILTNAGLVVAVKEKQWRWYRRNEKALRQVLKLLKTTL
jgi:DNA-binding transcriptional ArsR family regulator